MANSCNCSPRRRKRENEVKEIFEEIMPDNFSKLLKNTKP